MMSHPEKVQAISIAKTGGVEVIEKTEIPFPTVKPGEVLIKVEYCGVNFIDTYFRQGLYKFGQLPAVLGKEISGVVVELPTDESVLNNATYQSKNLAIGSKVASYAGTHATYIVIPWQYVHPVPASVSTRTSAAVLLQGLTVATFVEEAYTVKKGDTILVHTIAGGVGLLFAQLLHHLGATVIGTTSTPVKAELAKKNGADHVILYRSEDTVQRVLDLTNNEGVDAIFDGVGKDTFEQDLRMIKRKGTIVSYGNASGPVENVRLLQLTEKNVKVLRPTMNNYVITPEEALHYTAVLFGYVEQGVLKPTVHKEYPFTAEGVKQAHVDLAAGTTTGKLVLNV